LLRNFTGHPEALFDERHGKVFFSYALVTGNFSVPLHTVRTSNDPMSIIVLVYVRLCEAACRCIILEGIGKKDLPMPYHLLNK
jgi:hypothetical protein